MKLTKYQLKALRLWLHYYHSGYSFDQWFRKSWKIYLPLIVTIPCCIFMVFSGAPSFGWGLLGFFVGTLLRDLTYFRITRRTWPVTVDIIDWKRVQHLVDGHDQPAK